ncbi:Hexokinase [Aspergillus sclerotialis]|uniref:Phosphotransferase n=1 Tax=Aspergillus sclerotialis TaxID=2070753 RepID=A0A3A2ZVB2_9EURO|nr:Hexokinase [Aspergillus sclerotialis]
MPQSMSEYAEASVQARKIAQEFDVGSDQLCRVMRHFVQMMRDGLINRRAYQLPSYVKTVPTGTEKGRFLAVDLGGSNCRICLVDLHGDATFTVIRNKHTVPAEARINQSYKHVFSFVADRIADFLKTHVDLGPGETQRYQLGFTFSFTYEQTSLAQGTLIRWDKGWDIPDAVGQDPCAMLQEAIDDLGLPVQVSALANDSVGTLLTRAYTSGQGRSTLGAVIFGTGTNAAYIEKLPNIKRIETNREAGGIMVINTEWGCFDEELKVLPSNQYDHELDANSGDSGSQMFEKHVSGMYLGELLRLAILQLHREGAIQTHFNDGSCLFQKGGIDSSFLSRLAGNDARNPELASAIVTDTLMAENVTAADVQSVQIVAAAIARRAARLAGASLAAIIVQSGRLGTAPSSGKLSNFRVQEYGTPIEAGRPFVSKFQRLFGSLRLLRRVLAFLGMGIVISVRPPLESPEPVTNPVDSPEEAIIDIGADGSLIEFHPTFEMDMRAAMREIPEIGPDGEKRIRIGLAKDGSGVGAALMAQTALQEK